MTPKKTSRIVSASMALALVGLAFVLIALPAASAEGYACSSYHTVYTQGGATTESYGQNCPVAVDEGGHAVCLGYHEDTVNHYNDPNEPSSTAHSESCDTGLGGGLKTLT